MQSFPKPLTAKEEKECLARCRSGDEEARNLLIEKNLRLVAYIARKYNVGDKDMDDLISIGTIGLIKGIDTFDETKNIRLATYAARCIDKAMHFAGDMGWFSNVLIREGPIIFNYERKMKLKRKYYLIDSENVGDRWFELLQKIGKKDQVITFYTENHSNRLKEYLLTQVHNPKILWLECATGNNALDYQLIGVLAYLIAKHPKASFCIYSNDKDYQNTVDFWQSRGIRVCRKGFVEASKKKNKKKKGKNKQTEQKQKAGRNKQTEREQKAGTDTQVVWEQKDEMKIQPPISPASGRAQIPRRGKLTDEQYVKEIAKSVPLSDLGSWYQALTAILGQEKGRDWYLKIKDDGELRATLSRYFTGDGHFRGVNLIAAVLNLHELDVTRAEEAYRIIQSHNRKNLKAIRADFDKIFGKKPQQKYFKVLRPIIRVIKGKGFQ